MATLRPVGIVVGLDCVHFLITTLVFSVFLTFVLCALRTPGSDAEWWQLLGCDKLISHHIGSAYLKPTLHRVILTGNQLYDKCRFTFCWLITCLVVVEVITDDTMFDLSHICIMERIGRIVADARFEAL